MKQLRFLNTQSTTIMVDKIEQLLQNGRIKLALEMMIKYSKTSQEDEFHKKAIFDVSRLISIEDKFLKGLITFEQALTEENKVKLSTINLLSEFIYHEEEPNEEEYSLIGRWQCRYYDLRAEQYLKVFWNVNEDGSFLVELFTDKNKLNKRVEGKWKLDGNIYVDQFPNGKEGKGVIEWVDNSKIIYTIFISEYGNLNDSKRVYTRVEV